MAKWSFVARAADLVDDGPHHVSSGGVDAVLVRLDGELKAFEGLCPHQGALLGEGELLEGKLICRNHRWCFNARTGAREGGPQQLASYPLREVNGKIELDLSAASSGEGSKVKRRREELPGPRSWPVVGNAMQLGLKTLHLDLERWAKEYGRVFKIDLGTTPAVVISEPELIAEALRQRPGNYSRTIVLRKIFVELGIDGVFSSEGETWRPQRRLAMGALNPRRVKAFFPMLREVTDRLKKRWETAADEGSVLELQTEMMRFTVDITTRLAFSQETNTVGGETSTLLEHLDPVFPILARRLFAVFPYWRYLKLPADKKVERSLDAVRDWLADVIAKTRAELENDPERQANPQNFLESMLMARDAKGEAFGDDVIFGNAIQMLLAGEDTTANTMAWAVHLLLEEPLEVQALREGVDAVLKDTLLAEDMGTARKLAAVERVANETMRLKPVAPFIFLTANRDAVLGDLQVERGTTLVLLTRPASMDPEFVEAPDVFRPARWEDKKAIGALQRSGTFVPFGSGPRICPGRSLALLEMQMVLSMLYRNFDVERVGAAGDVTELSMFTMTPDNLRVRLHRRSP